MALSCLPLWRKYAAEFCERSTCSDIFGTSTQPYPINAAYLRQLILAKKNSTTANFALLFVCARRRKSASFCNCLRNWFCRPVLLFPIYQTTRRHRAQRNTQKDKQLSVRNGQFYFTTSL